MGVGLLPGLFFDVSTPVVDNTVDVIDELGVAEQSVRVESLGEVNLADPGQRVLNTLNVEGEQIWMETYIRQCRNFVLVQIAYHLSAEGQLHWTHQ